MAREQEYEEEEEAEETEEVEEAPAPAPVKKPVAKKPVAAPSAKPAPKPQAPQVQYVKIPVFESQAQQIFYDTLLAIDAKLAKIDADLELMKKYLPQ